jgi:hypothetical protein
LIDPRQFDRLDRLPQRPPDLVPPGTDDPIGFLLEKPDTAEIATGSVKPREKKQ